MSIVDGVKEKLPTVTLNTAAQHIEKDAKKSTVSMDFLGIDMFNRIKINFKLFASNTLLDTITSNLYVTFL